MGMGSDDYGYAVLGKRFPLPLIDGNNYTRESILLNATLLFATRGYASVSMRDLAEVSGIRPPLLYNHFPSKEALWRESLRHAEKLYRVYFKRLDEAIAGAQTFGEVLEIVFFEPKKMANMFTCYAFGMIQSEQFRDREAGDIFTETLLKHSREFLEERFERCIAKGMVERFDVRTVARIIVNSVLIGMGIAVQQCMGREMRYDMAETFEGLQRFILQSVKQPATDSAR